MLSALSIKAGLGSTEPTQAAPPDAAHQGSTRLLKETPRTSLQRPKVLGAPWPHLSPEHPMSSVHMTRYKDGLVHCPSASLGCPPALRVSGPQIHGPEEATVRRWLHRREAGGPGAGRSRRVLREGGCCLLHLSQDSHRPQSFPTGGREEPLGIIQSPHHVLLCTHPHRFVTITTPGIHLGI